MAGQDLFTNWSFATGQNLQAAMSQQQQAGPVNPLSSDKFQRSIIEGDFEFLKFLPYDELTMRMAGMLKKIFQVYSISGRSLYLLVSGILANLYFLHFYIESDCVHSYSR